VQQPSDQRRLAVIDMADDDDADLRPGGAVGVADKAGVAERAGDTIMFMAALTPKIRQR
jgi:hypothetical protein